MNTADACKILEGQGYKVYSDGTPADDEHWGFFWLTPKQTEKYLRSNKYLQYRAELRAAKVLYRVWRGNCFLGVYTGRKLVKKARLCQRRFGTTIVKKNEKVKRRAATRTAISKGNFDKLPAIEPKWDDIWNYD